MKQNGPVRPSEPVKETIERVPIGGLDEKNKRENDEALEAAYHDEEPPFLNRTRLKYEEASGSTREGDQMGATRFPDPESGRVDAPGVEKGVDEPAEDGEQDDPDVSTRTQCRHIELC